jgi:hypothetical protein
VSLAEGDEEGGGIGVHLGGLVGCWVGGIIRGLRHGSSGRCLRL